MSFVANGQPLVCRCLVNSKFFSLGGGGFFGN